MIRPFTHITKQLLQHSLQIQQSFPKPFRSFSALSTKLQDDFSINRLIGQGSFASVYEATSKNNGQLYAVKSIPKYSGSDPEKECALMRRINHENVVKFIYSYEDKTHVHIVTEQCKGGELFERISRKGKYSERDAARIIKQIIQAVDTCHDAGIVHRDIKPENILCKSSDEICTLCLIDFGVAEECSSNHHFHKFVGSPTYVAPEVLLEDYTASCDVWSIGVILYMLLCGRSPWKGTTSNQIAKNVLYQEIDYETPPWVYISKEAKSFVRSILDRNPNSRPTVKALLSDPWIVGNTADTDLTEAVENMNRLQSESRFKEAAIEITARHMKEKLDSDSILSLFQDRDKDNDGYLSLQEISDAVGTMNVQELQDQTTFNTALPELDTSACTSTVGIDEFILFASNKHAMLKQKEMLDLFLSLDRDHSGKISMEELKIAAAGYSEKDVALIMDAADVNHDGEIDYSEFVVLMQKHQQPEHQLTNLLTPTVENRPSSTQDGSLSDRSNSTIYHP